MASDKRGDTRGRRGRDSRTLWYDVGTGPANGVVGSGQRVVNGERRAVDDERRAGGDEGAAGDNEGQQGTTNSRGLRRASRLSMYVNAGVLNVNEGPVAVGGVEAAMGDSSQQHPHGLQVHCALCAFFISSFSRRLNCSRQ